MSPPPLKVDGVAEIVRVLGHVDVLRGVDHSRPRRLQLHVQLKQEPTPVDRRLGWPPSPSPSPGAWGRGRSGERLIDCLFHVMDLEHLAVLVDGLKLPSVGC